MSFKKTYCRMSPETAKQFRRTYEAWDRKNSGKRVHVPEPLSFEVPEAAIGEGDFVILAQHLATITADRYYAQTALSRSRMWMFLWCMSLCVAIAFSVLAYTDLAAERFTPAIWAPLVLSLALFLFGRRKERRADRNACHIFERSTGKAYLYYSEKAHRVYNFYDLHFSISDIMTAPAATSSKLEIGVTDPETGEHTGLGTFRLPTNEEAWQFWYALVRYMDKDWPFHDEDMELFAYVEQEKRKAGFRVEGVRYPDGSVEWV